MRAQIDLSKAEIQALRANQLQIVRWRILRVTALLISMLFVAGSGVAVGAPKGHSLNVDNLNVGQLEAFELENGFRVVLAKPRHMALMSEALLVVKAGTEYEPEVPADLAWLSAEALFAGSMEGSDETIRHFLARSGISMDFTVGREVAVFRFSIPTFQTIPFVHFLAQLLKRVEISETAWAEAMERRQQSIAGQQADLWQRSTRMLESLTWQGVPPPGMAQQGVDESPSIDELRQAEFLKAAYAPSRMVLSIWGEFPLEMFLVAIPQQFSQLQAAVGSSTGLSTRGRPKPVPADRAQTRCYEASGARPPALFVGLSTQVEDDFTFYGLQVLAQILGASDVSRLHQRMRLEEGLTYTVEASCTMVGASGLTMRVVSQTDQVERAQQVILEEIERLRRQEVSQEELQASRAILRSRLLLDHESLRDQFYRHSLRLLTDEPVRDPVAAEKVLAELTPRRLLEIARSSLHPDGAVTMVVSEQAASLCAAPRTASSEKTSSVTAPKEPDAEAQGGVL